MSLASLVTAGARFRRVRAGLRACTLAMALLAVTSVPGHLASVGAQTGSGRVLASARGQVGWLDLVAPRPTPLTQFVLPVYPADVDAVSGVSFAVASVVSAFGPGAGVGGDLVLLDLQTGASSLLLKRQSDAESLDMPALWPDGHGILFQRSNVRVALPLAGQATPQYQSRVEQVGPDGSNPTRVIDDARYPSPSPDGSRIAFVRSGAHSASVYLRTVADGSETAVVDPDRFLAIAYPRFSPDGQQLAFAAISVLAPAGHSAGGAFASWLSTGTALAHGFPWEVWLVNTDGSNLHQISDILDDDPSVAWAPDGSQLLVYGGWGSFLVDARGGGTTSTSLPYLAGYGSVAWLPY
jgi:Tol biopolymer transport system component